MTTNKSEIIQSQKNLADKMITKLRAFDPYCILAGGAPRDWYFNEIATDLDFYVYQQCEGATLTSVGKRLRSLGFEYSLCGANDIDFQMYEKNKDIKAVFNILNVEFPIQIIVLKTPTFKIVDNFPMSICKAWYLPERGVVTTGDFNISVKTGTIFITNKIYSNTDKYVNKIISKFKDKFDFAPSKEVAISRYFNGDLNV